MPLTAPLADARRRLGLEPGADAQAVKRAYRRLTLEHPPDRDPEGFRRLREAYELLCRPLPALLARLRREAPLIEAAAAPGAVPSDASAVLAALFRDFVARLPRQAFEDSDVAPPRGEVER